MPPNFLCPLTMELMREPVMDHDGHNFEQEAILAWIIHEGQAFCPISHKPLEPHDLVPNDALRQTIQRWMEKHNDQTETSDPRDENHGIGQDESMELGEANSRTRKGAYVCCADNEDPDETGDNQPTKCQQGELRHSSSSIVYTMFLPQEREAIAVMQRQARERREAKRLARFAHAGIALSAAFVFVVFILFLIKLARGQLFD